MTFCNLIPFLLGLEAVFTITRFVLSCVFVCCRYVSTAEIIYPGFNDKSHSGALVSCPPTNCLV